MSSGSLVPGLVVGEKYQVEREIAEGGLGIVVLATQLELGRPVAIKYLKRAVLANPVLVERFKREAKLASSIHSEHVVRVYDVGSHPSIGPYMVMEYLEGEDLGDRVQRGPLPVREAIDFVVQACDALAEAHALGIVHRDLKPDNLFLARRPGSTPILKILDFGISKLTDRKAGPDAVRAKGLTADGACLGTPVYMSPEQLLANRPVDTRTDIWSLGVVLFELVTAALPFEGQSIPHLGANIVGGPPLSLRSKLPDASPALEAVIAKCLEKNPDARYRNVAELVEELVQFEAPGSQPRVGRIRHVVSHGGESIRPPRPLGKTPTDDVSLLVPASTPPSPAPPARITASASPTPMGGVSPQSAPPAKGAAGATLTGTQGIGVFLLLVAAIGIAIVVLDRHPAPRPTASVVNAVPPPTPTTLSTPEPPAGPRAAPASAPASSSTASATSAAPVGSARPKATPSKPKNDYSEFGERH